MTDHASLIEEARTYGQDPWRLINRNQRASNLLRNLADALEAAELPIAEVRAAAWDQGWDAGNDYAIAEPWDLMTDKKKNPHRSSTRGQQ